MIEVFAYGTLRDPDARERAPGGVLAKHDRRHALAQIRALRSTSE
jgi:hypothetical protein